MTDELREHLLRIIDEAIDRDEEHLSWLAQNPQEPDREAQLVDTQRSLALSRQLRDLP
jgi:hypothetical protein